MDYKPARPLTWTKVAFHDEMPEWRRVAKASGIPEAKLRQLYGTGKNVQLQPTMWRHLQNTDSTQNHTETSLKRVLSKVRDVDAIVHEYKTGKVRMPIVLCTGPHGKQSYTLVAGNTRLCVAKLLKIAPRVVLVTVEPPKTTAGRDYKAK